MMFWENDFSGIIQFRLVVDAYKDLRTGSSRFHPRHGKGAVQVPDPCFVCCFMDDGRQFHGMLIKPQAALDHFDLHIIIRLIFHVHYAVKMKILIPVFIHIP